MSLQRTAFVLFIINFIGISLCEKIKHSNMDLKTNPETDFTVSRMDTNSSMLQLNDTCNSTVTAKSVCRNLDINHEYEYLCTKLIQKKLKDEEIIIETVFDDSLKSIDITNAIILKQIEKLTFTINSERFHYKKQLNEMHFLLQGLVKAVEKVGTLNKKTENAQERPKSIYYISELEIMFRVSVFELLFLIMLLFNIYYFSSIIYCVYKNGFGHLDK